MSETVSVFEIPLIAASQTFGITLNGTAYVLTVTWRNAVSTWFLDIADSQSNPLVCGIPLVTGCDLLAPYASLGISGKMIVQTDGDYDAVPTYENLGTSSHLYFIPI